MSRRERAISEKVAAIDEIVRRLKRNMYDVIANDALLRRVHDHEDVIPTFNNTVEGHGFGVVQRGLISLQLLALMRCYDRRSDNRASLPHLVDVLKESEVFEAVTCRAREWNPGMRLEEANERTAKERVTFAIREYDRYMGVEDFQLMLTALRQHRDDHLAHSLFDMGERRSVLFGYLSDVMRETIPVVAALDLGVLGNHWGPEDTIRVWDQNADAFWRRTLPR